MRSRFHPLHMPRYWLLALLPLWAVVFAITLKLWASQQVGWMTVFIEPQAGAYPVVSEIMPGAGVEAAGIQLDDRLIRSGAGRRNWVPPATARIQVGDRLIRVGSRDLKGVGRLEFAARVYEQSSADLQAQVVIERGTERYAATLPLYREHFPDWLKCMIALAFAVVGVLILWRAPDTRMSRLFYLACIALSTYVASVLGPGPAAQTYFMLAAYVASTTLLVPLQLLALMALVETPGTLPTRLPRWPWLFLIFAPSPIARVTAWPLEWKSAFVFHFSLTALALATILFVLIRGFRRTDALGRRRLKWVVYGYTFGFGPNMLLNLLVTALPSLLWLFEVVNLLVLLVPLSIFIATVRSQLFDIDRLISATTTFSILAVLLLASLLALAPRAAQAVSQTLGLDAGVFQMLFSLLLAGLIVPAHRYLRPWMDRVFFAERQTLERGIEHLLLELSATGNAHALWTKAGEALDALLHPELCVIYARDGASYVPVFVRGKAMPPVLGLDHALLRTLQRRNVAQKVSRFSVGPAFASRERTALQNLGAAMLLPVSDGNALVALICLGHKRSGDVYIGSDVALLTAVAHAMARELRRFDAMRITA